MILSLNQSSIVNFDTPNLGCKSRNQNLGKHKHKYGSSFGCHALRVLLRCLKEKTCQKTGNHHKMKAAPFRNKKMLIEKGL